MEITTPIQCCNPNSNRPPSERVLQAVSRRYVATRNLHVDGQWNDGYYLEKSFVSRWNDGYYLKKSFDIENRLSQWNDVYTAACKRSDDILVHGPLAHI